MTEPIAQSKNRTWLNIIPFAIVLSLFALIVTVYFSRYDHFDAQNFRAFIGEFGAWGPLVYAAIYIICAPVPLIAPVLSAAGGLLFGTLWGTLLVMGVATTSAFVPFYLARRLGREWVEGKLKGKRLEELYAQSEGGKGFTFILLMRLIPILPWEIQNYVGGLTKVSPLTFIAGTLIGIIPGSFSLVFLGSAATDPTSWQFVAAIALKIATALIPVVALTLRKRQPAEGK